MLLEVFFVLNEAQVVAVRVNAMQGRAAERLKILQALFGLGVPESDEKGVKASTRLVEINRRRMGELVHELPRYCGPQGDDEKMSAHDVENLKSFFNADNDASSPFALLELNLITKFIAQGHIDFKSVVASSVRHCSGACALTHARALTPPPPPRSRLSPALLRTCRCTSCSTRPS